MRAARPLLLFPLVMVLAGTTGCRRLAEKIVNDRLRDAGAPTTPTARRPMPVRPRVAATLPAGWPADVPLPSDAALTASSVSKHEQTTTYSATYETGAAPEEAFAHFKRALRPAGYKQTTTSSNTSTYGTTESATFTKGSYRDGSVYVSVSPTYGRDGNTVRVSVTTPE